MCLKFAVVYSLKILTFSRLPEQVRDDFEKRRKKKKQKKNFVCLFLVLRVLDQWTVSQCVSLFFFENTMAIFQDISKNKKHTHTDNS